MQELIRPALFLVAKLGIFLCVLALMTGQAWQGTGFVSGFTGAVDSCGVGIALDTRMPTEWGIEAGPGDSMVRDFLSTAPNVSVRSEERYLSLSVIAIYVCSSEVAFAARHWLLIGMFILFYSVLKYVYRGGKNQEQS